MYAFPKITKAVKTILIIHGIGFLMSIFSPYVMGNFFSLSTSNAFYPFSLVWSIFTYPIVNGDIVLLLFFGLFMWWVGSRLEDSWGTKLFTIFYYILLKVFNCATFLI